MINARCTYHSISAFLTRDLHYCSKSSRKSKDMSFYLMRRNKGIESGNKSWFMVDIGLS